MKKLLLILILFFWVYSFGQEITRTIYKNSDDLTIVYRISHHDIYGEFSVHGDGFGGQYFQLDSNMTFKKISFGCGSRFTIDSGSWTIKKENNLILKSGKRILKITIIKVDNFYFFLFPEQIQKFNADLKVLKLKFKNKSPIKIDNKTYSIDHMIGFSLNDKYYAKEIEDIAGT